MPTASSRTLPAGSALNMPKMSLRTRSSLRGDTEHSVLIGNCLGSTVLRAGSSGIATAHRIVG